MRLMLGMTMGLLTLAGLAGCGQSDQALRTTAREALLLGCRTGNASAREQLNQMGVSMDRLCTCAVDRYMQGASSEELKQFTRNPGAPPAALTSAAAQCTSEMVTQANPAAAAAASNAGTAEPAAPGEAPAEGAAPAEENTAEH